MAYTRTNQSYLALDSSVLIPYLDGEHPQHSKVRSLAHKRVALNPTVIHETYHALVYKLKWIPEEAGRILREVLNERKNLFVNQTRDTTKLGLRLAEEYGVGGRDALILASFLHSAISEMLTFDKAILALGTIVYGRDQMRIKQP